MATALPAPRPETRDVDLDVLAKSPLLAALPPEKLAVFLDELDQVAVAAGTFVVRENEPADTMFFVLEGEARLLRGQLELRTVHPGGHFHEIALLDPTYRTATSVEAHTVLRLARLTRRRYESLVSTDKDLALAFTQGLARAIGGRLRQLTESVGILYQRSMPRKLMVRVRRAQEELDVPTGTLAGSLLPRESEGSRVIAATLAHKPASLETPIVADVEISPLTLADVEGRSVYRRSAALLVLEAARRAQIDVRMGPPLENGQVVAVVGEPDRAALATALLDAVERLVREDVPMREEVWAVEEAREELAERGWADAASLLVGRREPTVTLLTCGETIALRMGPVVPHAGYVEGLSLVPHPSGLLLRLGEAVDHTMPVLHGERIDPIASETSTPRYGGEMTSAERKWLDGMGITSVGKFDEACVSGNVDEIVRVAEGFHEKWIGRIADEITQRSDRVKIVVVAGPSSSGKTTFIKRLTVQLLVNGIRPLNLSLDDYYVDRDKTVRDETGEYDFEAFEAIDVAMFRGHVQRLLSGERVQTAHYDFVHGKSFPSGGKELALGASDVILVEGIHGLNPTLLGDGIGRDVIFRVFVHPATTLPFDRLSVGAPDDLRLVRRIVRDRHQRNYTAADTILRWPSVRRGELCHIYPYLPHADVVFDSALVYEPSVLKTYAERYLLEVPEEHPAFGTAHRLRNLIDQFVAIYADHVPPTSLLREFIGGSGFEY